MIDPPFAKLPHRNAHSVRFSGVQGERTPDYRGPFTLPLNVAHKTSGKVRQFGDIRSSFHGFLQVTKKKCIFDVCCRRARADERAKYQLDMTTERDIQNQIVYARDKGLEEGRAEGARERAVESAKFFLQLGLTVEDVAKGTGLTVEEINSWI